jgi:hypothetical protein
MRHELNSMKKGRLLGGLQLRGKDLNLRPLGYEIDLIVSRASFSTVYVANDRQCCRVFGSCCPPNWPPVCPPIDHRKARAERVERGLVRGQIVY